MITDQCVDIVIFNYPKAFDKVCYNVLMQKLSDIDACTQLLNCISYLLRNRTMQVTVLGVFSHSVNVTSGVPQGSVLGSVSTLTMLLLT